MNTPSIIVTDRSITVVFIGESPKVITADHANFAKCKEDIKNRDWDSLRSNIDVESAVKRYVSVSGDIYIDNGVVKYKGEAVHNLIVDRILQFMTEDMPFEPLVKFLENLMQNPSYRARKELYAFLEHEALPITEDGHFLAYKAVRSDFMDIWSGTIYNGIGSVVKMQRSNVDDDCNRGCSSGLHAGSIDYVRGYGNDSSRFLIVKINPANVVSVPSEDSRKLRTCEYVVVSEFKDKLTKACYTANGNEICDDDFCDDIEDCDDDDFYDDDDCDCCRCRRNS
jgi:hypothetical protein